MNPQLPLHHCTTTTAVAGDDEDTAAFFDLPVADDAVRKLTFYSLKTDLENGESILTEVGRRSADAATGRTLISELILTSSPADDLFFKGRLHPLTPSTISSSKPSSKLRILMLGFKKSAASAADADADVDPAGNSRKSNKSLFTITTSKSKNSGRQSKVHAGDGDVTSPDRKAPADGLQRYFNKIKPLYVKVSKRYGEKLRFGSEGRSKSFPSPAAPASFPAGLKRRLGKSRSASASVAAVRSPPPPAVRRRDDSLIEQQDGIQSAIAHCKRSLEGSP